MSARAALEMLPLNKRIRRARKDAGYTQETFAAAVGTSRRHVMRWENNNGNASRPGVDYARRIGEVTGQPAELFRDEDDEEDRQQMAEAFRLFRDLMAALPTAKVPA